MEKKVKTVEQIERDNKLYPHHSAWSRGYVSRKNSGWCEEYKGRFGAGYKVHRPTRESTQYHIVEYYVAR